MKNTTEPHNKDKEKHRASCCAITTSRPRKPFIYGSTAAFVMVGFYLGLITLTSDWYNAKAQFNEYRWWVIALAVGLGIQVSLFTRMRQAMTTMHLKGAASGMAASGGMSGVAMALCCSHYLAGLLPLIGLPFLSTAIAGLARYQTEFFLVGLISNLLAMTYMVWMMFKRGLISELPLLHPYRGYLSNK